MKSAVILELLREMFKKSIIPIKMRFNEEIFSSRITSYWMNEEKISRTHDEINASRKKAKKCEQSDSLVLA